MNSARSVALATMVGLGLLASVVWTGFLGYQIFQVVVFFL